jgi:hypothetical protein
MSMNGKQHRILHALIWLPLLVAILSPGAALAEVGKQLKPSLDEARIPELRVERTLALAPAPDAEVVIPGFRALFLSDGSVTVRGEGQFRASSPTVGFDFEVDLVQGTYKTSRLNEAEIEERLPHQYRMERNPRLRPELEGPRTNLKVSPGGWWGRVRVQTKDPAFIVLTETSTELAWTTFFDGTVDWDWWSDGCWAANPSSLGTHWFVSSCWSGPVWFTSASRVCHDHGGSYFNDDFMLDSLRTNASQYAIICGRNDALFDYNWSHNDSGEASLLIFGTVVLN